MPSIINDTSTTTSGTTKKLIGAHRLHPLLLRATTRLYE